MLDEFHADRLARHLAPLRQSRSAEFAPPGSGRFHWRGVMTDLRHAVRELRAAPEFTIVALVVLMLGIGATTAIFSVVDAVVLRGLPFDEHDRLVAVGERRPPGPRDTNYDPHALMSVATAELPGLGRRTAGVRIDRRHCRSVVQRVYPQRARDGARGFSGDAGHRGVLRCPSCPSCARTCIHCRERGRWPAPRCRPQRRPVAATLRRES